MVAIVAKAKETEARLISLMMEGSCEKISRIFFGELWPKKGKICNTIRECKLFCVTAYY